MLPMITASATAFALAPMPHPLIHQPVAVRGVSAIIMMAPRRPVDNEASSSGSMCHLLSAEELDAVTDLMSQSKHNDYGYTVCQEPSEDPSMTCFLKPDNWSKEVPQQGDWLCMQNPSVNLTPSINSEDSY